MKKFLFASVFALGAVFFMACSKEDTTNTTTNEVSAQAANSTTNNGGTAEDRSMGYPADAIVELDQYGLVEPLGKLFYTSFPSGALKSVDLSAGYPNSSGSRTFKIQVLGSSSNGIIFVGNSLYATLDPFSVGIGGAKMPCPKFNPDEPCDVLIPYSYSRVKVYFENRPDDVFSFEMNGNNYPMTPTMAGDGRFYEPANDGTKNCVFKP